MSPAGRSGQTTWTVDRIAPAVRPTLVFVGVTTGASSIRTVFPAWAEALGLGDAELVGIDVPLHAPAADHRRVVEAIRDDPLVLGALVTTHKLDLFRAAADLFDEVDTLAALLHEVSSISKRDGRLRAHAKDPLTAGLAIDALVPAGWFERTGADAVVFGAGGAAVAIDWHLGRPERGADAPRRVVVTDLVAERLAHLREIHDASGSATDLVTVFVEDAAAADEVLAEAPEGSLVVNATGLGKDGPGSPVSGAARFPRRGVAWELNYRGDLVFLESALAQRDAAALTVADGWRYFVHGWTSVIAEVFDVDIPISGPAFDHLSDIAAGARR